MQRWKQLLRWEKTVLLGLAWRLPFFWLLLRLSGFAKVLSIADNRVARRIAAGPQLPDGWLALAFARRCEQLTAIAACNGVFHATCLPQALALHDLLGCHGLPARIKIGVMPGSKPLLAHAWVEYDAQVLGAPVGQYIPVSGLSGFRSFTDVTSGGLRRDRISR